jgi:hypothetical protein
MAGESNHTLTAAQSTLLQKKTSVVYTPQWTVDCSWNCLNYGINNYDLKLYIRISIVHGCAMIKFGIELHIPKSQQREGAKDFLKRILFLVRIM